jgi:hypothetical protein
MKPPMKTSHPTATMEHIKVLLFELDSASGAGKRIRELLEAAAGTKFELKHHIVPPSNIPIASRHLARILATSLLR